MYSGEAVETGTVKDVFDRMRHPYTQGLFRSIPLPGADKNTRPLIAIPGQLPLPHERPQGCNFGPRCQHFVEGPLRRGRDPDDRRSTGTTNHCSRCVRFNEIDWVGAAGSRRASTASPSKPGAPVLKIDDLRKYYQVAANAIFGRRRRRASVKANETISFEAREAGDGGDRRRVRLRQVDPGQGAARPGDGDCRAASTLGNKDDPVDRAIEMRDVRPSSSIQMVFQNPFDTLNPSHTVGAQIIRTLEKFDVGRDRPTGASAMLRTARPR